MLVAKIIEVKATNCKELYRNWLESGSDIENPFKLLRFQNSYHAKVFLPLPFFKKGRWISVGFEMKDL